MVNSKRHNLKQKELASILNIRNTTYCSYESEYEIIPIEHLNTLCNFFNVSLDYMLEFTEIENYKNSKSAIDIKLAGERLKQIRKKNKYTQKLLAKLFNIPQSMISYYENSYNIIPLTHLYCFCQKFNVSADYMLGKIDIDPFRTIAEEIMENILNVFEND